MTADRVPGAAPSRIRLGIVGLGAVAQAVHLPLIARWPEAFRVAAVADLSRTIVDAVGDRYRVPADRRFLALADMLDGAELDALLILTSGSHGQAVLDGFDRGLAVFAEKPLAYTLAEADAIAARMAADPRLRLQVGYMKLYDPAVMHARQAVETGGFGPPRAVEVTVLHPSAESQLAHARLLPPSADIAATVRDGLSAGTRALQDIALGPEAASTVGRLYTGILLGSIVHELALVRAFAGDPTAIDGLAWWPATAWPPSVGLTGRLAHDGRLSIQWHFLPDYPAYREEVRVVYEAATVELSFPSPYLLHRPTELWIASRQEGDRRDERWSSTVEAFEQELLAFHRLVVDGEPARAGLAEGRADIVTCQRAIASLAASAGIAVGGEAGRAAVGNGIAG